MSFTEPIQLTNQSTAKDREFVLRPIYQQVLERQPYDWEREKYLAPIEK